MAPEGLRTVATGEAASGPADFVAPEGLRTVATGEAASGPTDDAKPVVEVRSPYFVAPEERRNLKCRAHDPDFCSPLVPHDRHYTLPQQLLCPCWGRFETT